MADIDFGISVGRMACATVLCVRGEVDVATAAGGHGVRVVAAGRECVRPIRLTGLDTVLSMHGTVAEALN